MTQERTELEEGIRGYVLTGAATYTISSRIQCRWDRVHSSTNQCIVSNSFLSNNPYWAKISVYSREQIYLAVYRWYWTLLALSVNTLAMEWRQCNDVGLG